MSRPATDRLKCSAPLGMLPILQWALPAQLLIDPDYQRSIDTSQSQSLIRKIAQHWDWSLCLPLVVARRPGGEMYVIDGQHRLAAAKMRGDIAQLPCVIVEMSDKADEAASFVLLNTGRVALGKLAIFKAAIASGDSQASAIIAAMTEAGLSVAPHQNYISWKPGMISNIGGVEAAWRQHGPRVTSAALAALGEAMAGKVLRYAGSIFPGIVAVCADEMADGAEFDPDIRPLFIEMICEGGQEMWRTDIMRARADNPNLKFAAASAQVFRTAWKELMTEIMGEAA